ncbi:MAG TPA: SET domain-containing protein [Acidimicrobiales bacterium]|nr:SET domain-containing protein [Acidimicrobiales bacterium]
MNHIDAKVAARSAGAKGDGLYATKAIRAGETVVAFGGYAIDRETLNELPPGRRMHAIQIDTDLFLVGPDPAEPGDLVNHSCDPNCGLVGAVLVVAMRDIDPGEEITFDYAMCDSTDYDEFDCSCDTPHCRKRVTGDDWKRPDLQQRYAGWFSSYLARQIAALPSQGAARRAFAA